MKKKTNLANIMTPEQKRIALGKQVAKLKRGKVVKYIKPVAYERAKTMGQVFGYDPIVSDVFTLKPNPNY